MKNLLLNYSKITRSFHQITSMNKTVVLGSCRFSNVKMNNIDRTKNNNIDKSQANQPAQIQTLKSRQQYQKQAMDIIKSYITIDEIKSKPGAIEYLLLTLLGVLQYDKEDNGQRFYKQNKEKVDKIMYDLKSYNSESQMSTKEILLTFYLSKLVNDYGVNQRVQGFELRGGIKLVNHIQANYRDSIAQPLTLNEIIVGYWLMSNRNCSNHEYKWKTYLKMLDVRSKWYLQTSKYFTINSSGNKVYATSKPPLTFTQMSIFLSNYYFQTTHLSTEYRTYELFLSIFFVNRHAYASYQQLQTNQTMFLQTYTNIIGLDQHWLCGQTNYELLIIINLMSDAVERKLISWLTEDESVQKSFVESKSLQQFLSKKQFQTYEEMKGQNKLVGCQIKGFREEDLYRYFVFLSQIKENSLLFNNLAFERNNKIQFILNEILDRYFSYKDFRDEEKNELSLSLFTRFWIIKTEIVLMNLEKEIQKIKKLGQNWLESKTIKTTLMRIVRQFEQLMMTLKSIILQKVSQIEGAGKNNPKKGKSYLTAKEKDALNQTRAYLQHIQINLVQPLIDFIYANGKNTILNTKLIPSQKLSIIKVFQDFLSAIFGDSVSLKQDQTQIKTLTIQNHYFWTLKYMLVQSIDVDNNDILLKEFQSLLSEHIIKNNTAKKTLPYTCLSLYNLYAYMCKLQEIMIRNQSKLSKTKLQADIGIQKFSSKKQYKHFVAYKHYLYKLIFQQKFQPSQHQKSQKINQTIEIPQKLRIKDFSNNLYEITENQNANKNYYKSENIDQTNLFGIKNIFNLVFRLNRYYNHKLFAQQIILSFFGTKQLLEQNSVEQIVKYNQRSGQNFYELTYLIVLTGSEKISVQNIPHKLSLKTIKKQLVEVLLEKAKGSRILNTIREVMAPRHISFMKKPPLKYSHKPYSIFEALSNQTVSRKIQVAHELFDFFQPDSKNLFAWAEIFLMNLENWGKSRSQIISQVFLPWFLNRVDKKEVIKQNIPLLVGCVLRLLRSSLLRITTQNQRIIIKFISQLFPTLFENLQRNKKQFIYIKLIGCLIEIETFVKRGVLNSNDVKNILQASKQKLMTTGNTQNVKIVQGSKSFLKMLQILERTLVMTRRLISNKAIDTKGHNKFQNTQRNHSVKARQESSIEFGKGSKQRDESRNVAVKKGLFSKNKTKIADKTE